MITLLLTTVFKDTSGKYLIGASRHSGEAKEVVNIAYKALESHIAEYPNRELVSYSLTKLS